MMLIRWPIPCDVNVVVAAHEGTKDLYRNRLSIKNIYHRTNTDVENKDKYMEVLVIWPNCYSVVPVHVCGSKVSRFLTTALFPSSLDQVLILGIIYLFRKQTIYVFAFSSNVYYLSWSLLQGHIQPHPIVFLLSTFQHSTFSLPLVPLLCRHSLLSLENIWRHIYWSVDCKIQTYTISKALFVCASYPSELSVCFLDTSQILNIGSSSKLLTIATSTEISIPGRSRKRPFSWANGVISIIHTLRVEGII